MTLSRDERPDPDAVLARVLVGIIRADADVLGLLGLVEKAPSGHVARYASGLTDESATGYRKLFGDPLNDRGPHILPGFEVTRAHIYADSFWLFAVDDSDSSHLPDVNRSDSVEFAELASEP